MKWTHEIIFFLVCLIDINLNTSPRHFNVSRMRLFNKLLTWIYVGECYFITKKGILGVCVIEL